MSRAVKPYGAANRVRLENPAAVASRPERRAAIAVSVCVHLCLLLLFAAIKWSLPVGQPLAALTSTFADVERPTDDVDFTVSIDVEASSDESFESVELLTTAAAAAADDGPMIETPALNAVPLPSGELPQEWLTADAPVSKTMTVNGRVGGDGGAAGEGSAAGSAVAGDGQFFGIPVAGKKIAFIIDGSSSMIEAFRAPERTRLARVKRELTKTIRSLSEDQLWYVVFFSRVAHPIPSNRFVTTEPAEREHYLKWVNGFAPGGGTNPLGALKGTFETVQPDVIFLLTDGEFPDFVLPAVDELNTRDIALHTIGLGETIDVRAEPTHAMKVLIELAVRNNGTTKFISDEP